MKVSYDPDYELATFDGPGGFTQQKMSQMKAEAIARALGIEFEVRRVIVKWLGRWPLYGVP